MFHHAVAEHVISHQSRYHDASEEVAQEAALYPLEPAMTT